MNLDALKVDSTWGESANTINQNMQRLQVAVERTSLSKEKNKGYFLTEAALKIAWPTPQKGDNASAGDPYPGVIYVCEKDGTWINTGKQAELPSIVQDNYVIDGGRADSVYTPADTIGGGGANI